MALTPQEVREKTFTATRMKVGYNEDEVDAFLDLVEAELQRLHAENTDLKARLAAGGASALAAPAAAPDAKKSNPFAIELRKKKAGEEAAVADDSAELAALQAEVADLKRKLQTANAALIKPTPGNAESNELLALRSANAQLTEKLTAVSAELATAGTDLAAATTALAAKPAAVAAAPTATEDMLSRTLVLAQKTADEAVAQAREEAARMVAEAMERAVALERQATVEHQAKLAEFTAAKTGLEAEIERLRSFEREYRTRLKAYLEMQLRDLVSAGSSSPKPPAVGSKASNHAPLDDDIEDAIEELDA